MTYNELYNLIDNCRGCIRLLGDFIYEDKPFEKGTGEIVRNNFVKLLEMVEQMEVKI